MKNRILSFVAIKRLFKKLGGKIGFAGFLELQKNIEENLIEIGKLAIKNASYEGRRVVKEEDIKEALKEIKESFS